MHLGSIQQFMVVLGSALSVTLLGSIERAIAQSPPACAPPASSEYLLLVISQTEDAEEQLRQTLPPNAAITTCRYLDQVVTRVGGFTDPEVANSWATYLTGMGDMEAFVARPSETAAGFPTPQPAISPTVADPPFEATQPSAVVPPSSERSAESSDVAYNPQPLAAGYAVLVDYFNRPEVALDVRQTTNGPVGVVSYGQKPYLLALYTSDLTVANTILQRLSDRSFLSMIVDSRRVVLLKPDVVLGESE